MFDMRRRKFLTVSGTALALLSGCSMPDQRASGAHFEIENVESESDFLDVVVDVEVTNSGTKQGSATLVVQLDLLTNTYEKEKEFSLHAGESGKYRFRFDLSGLDFFIGKLHGEVDARIEE
jgi:hypothetical protein